MIKDKLIYSKNYYGISENLKKGFEWLKNQDLKNIKPDKYLIDGDNLYANVQIYETKEDAKYEAHKKYIDIQYMIDGEELIGVCDINNCSTFEEYDQDKDIEFLNSFNKDEFQTIKEGEFLVLFPNDAHKPSILKDIKKRVKKVVVKVKID